MSKIQFVARLARSFIDTSLASNKKSIPEFCLLDTAMGSENLGDQIIMEACESVIKELVPKQNPIHLPTHYYVKESEYVKPFLKLLCGTNIIYKNMHGQQQWCLPSNINSFSNTCLFGVGMSDIGLEGETSAFSKAFYNCILSKKYIHSVRDERTKTFLNSIGINNVVNTSCPTTWNLTPQICKQIPKQKSKFVITTITDYDFDLERDSIMLDTLRKNYDKVFVWLQGVHDLNPCLNSYKNLSDLILIPRNLRAFDQALAMPNVDYVGTRLHAGIRALSKGVRALVISIDNRAKSMSQDIGLPVIDRSRITELDNKINEEWQTDIRLPTDAIAKWKSQFQFIKHL